MVTTLLSANCLLTFERDNHGKLNHVCVRVFFEHVFFAVLLFDILKVVFLNFELFYLQTHSLPFRLPSAKKDLNRRHFGKLWV